MRKAHSGNIFDQLMAIVESDPTSLAEFKVDQLRIALSLSLKKAREHSGKTQQQIAELLDVQQPWISKLESCNYDHTFESLARYLFALGADIALSATFDGGLSMELASSKNNSVTKYKAGHLPEYIKPVEDTPFQDWDCNASPNAFLLQPQDTKQKSQTWDLGCHVA